MLYIPDTGETVFPDMTNNDTGCATVYVLRLPGICTEKSPLNCEAIALTSFIMLTVDKHLQAKSSSY